MTEFLGELSIWGFFQGNASLMLQMQSMFLSDCGHSSINNVCNVCTWIRCLRSDQSVNNVSAYGAADTEQHKLFTYVILSEMAL